MILGTCYYADKIKSDDSFLYTSINKKDFLLYWKKYPENASNYMIGCFGGSFRASFGRKDLTNMWYFHSTLYSTYKNVIDDWNRKFKNLTFKILNDREIPYTIADVERIGWGGEKQIVQETILGEGEKVFNLPQLTNILSDDYSERSKIYLNYLMAIFIRQISPPEAFNRNIERSPNNIQDVLDIVNETRTIKSHLAYKSFWVDTKKEFTEEMLLKLDDIEHINLITESKIYSHYAQTSLLKFYCGE